MNSLINPNELINLLLLISKEDNKKIENILLEYDIQLYEQVIIDTILINEKYDLVTFIMNHKSNNNTRRNMVILITNYINNFVIPGDNFVAFSSIYNIILELCKNIKLDFKLPKFQVFSNNIREKFAINILKEFLSSELYNHYENPIEIINLFLLDCIKHSFSNLEGMINFITVIVNYLRTQKWFKFNEEINNELLEFSKLEMTYCRNSLMNILLNNR